MLRLLYLLSFLVLTARAQSTFSVITSADAFLPTGSANYQSGADLRDLNFGAAGTLAIAPASASKGEVRSVIRFSLANMVSQFDSDLGTNNWTITNISLELTSNYGTAGVQPNNPIFNTISSGDFVIEWMEDDSWIEGTGTPASPTTDGITYNLLPNYLEKDHIPLCTNTYTPPGNNVHVTWTLPLEDHLLADVQAGGDVSFYFYAADEKVGYLFNSYKYGRGNEPLIHVMAVSLSDVSPTILTAGSTNGVFYLTASAVNNLTYNVLVSTNLINWTTNQTVTADGNGGIRFSDAGAVTNAMRFYRLSR